MRLLGAFELDPAHPAGEPRGAVPRLLLARIALSGEAGVARETALGLLWPDSAQEAARHSLRQALVSLRAALGDALDTRDDLLRLRGVDVDVLRFEQAALENEAAAWERAIALWRGPLLDGITGRDTETENWLHEERRRLEQTRRELLYRLAARCSEGGAHDRAIDWARRLVREDPAHEPAQRLLMRALAEVGERASAMQQYRALCEHLQREFGAEPGPATRAQYREIVGDTQPAPPVAPTLAVLPLATDGAERSTLFADGLAQELVTLLTRMADLVVVDGHAIRLFGDAALDVRAAARELGAHFLLCGMVRADRERLRVAARLLDARDLRLVWSERYDRRPGDVFALQEEIAAEVTTALQVRLTEGEQVRHWRRTAPDLDSWLAFVEALALVRGVTRERNHRARALLEQALARHERFAMAWVYLGWTHVMDLRSGWTTDPARTLEVLRHCAARALALDPDLPDALNLQGGIEITLGRHDEAIALRRRAVALAPNHSESHAWLAAALYFGGDGVGAGQHIALAMRLSPFYPGWYPIVLGMARLAAGQAVQAERAFAESCERLPDNIVGDTYQIIAQVLADRVDDARHTAAAAVRRNPGFTIAQARRWLMYRDPVQTEARIDCLRRAGVPD